MDRKTAGAVQGQTETSGAKAPLGRFRMSVDLTGSRLGPTWRSVEVDVDPPEGWSNRSLRQMAAHHYGVPLANVTDPWPVRWDDSKPGAPT